MKDALFIGEIITVPGGVAVGEIAQVGTVMVSPSRVTAVFGRVAGRQLVSPVGAQGHASTLPAKPEPVPSAAELPTCQETLQPWARCEHDNTSCRRQE